MRLRAALFGLDGRVMWQVTGHPCALQVGRGCYLRSGRVHTWLRTCVFVGSKIDDNIASKYKAAMQAPFCPPLFAAGLAHDSKRFEPSFVWTLLASLACAALITRCLGQRNSSNPFLIEFSSVKQSARFIYSRPRHRASRILALAFTRVQNLQIYLLVIKFQMDWSVNN